MPGLDDDRDALIGDGVDRVFERALLPPCNSIPGKLFGQRVGDKYRNAHEEKREKMGVFERARRHEEEDHRQQNQDEGSTQGARPTNRGLWFLCVCCTVLDRVAPPQELLTFINQRSLHQLL